VTNQLAKDLNGALKRAQVRHANVLIEPMWVTFVKVAFVIVTISAIVFGVSVLVKL
jgi:hypothetical protein